MYSYSSCQTAVSSPARPARCRGGRGRGASRPERADRDAVETAPVGNDLLGEMQQEAPMKAGSGHGCELRQAGQIITGRVACGLDLDADDPAPGVFQDLL